MSYNVLEELVKEYYEYIKGYFVRTNVRFSKLENGGYGGEADILAYDSSEKNLFHIECSMAANSKKRYLEIAGKKFPTDLDYKKLLPNILLDPGKVKKIFIIGQNKKKSEIEMPDGVTYVNLGPFIREVYDTINHDIMKEIVPEAYPLLRAMQLAKWANIGREGIT